MPSTKKKSRRSSSSRSKPERSAWSKSASRIGTWWSKKVGGIVNGFTESIEKLYKSFAHGLSNAFGGIFKLFWPSSLSKKVENVGKAQSSGVAKVGKQVGELTEKVEKQFTDSASGFSEVLKFIGIILVPRFIRKRFVAVWSVVTKGVSRLSKQIKRKAIRTAKRYLPAWLVRYIRVVSLKWKQFKRNFAKFAGAWWSSRNFNTLAWSTPAILLLFPIVGVLGVATVNNRGERILHYRRAAIKANDERRVTDADLFRRKLRQLGYQRMEREEYLAALSFAEDGDYETAYERMKKIAPLDRGDGEQADEGELKTAGLGKPLGAGLEEEKEDFPYAHLWIAGQFYEGYLSADSEEEKWDLIRRHALRADEIEAETQSVRAKRVAEYYVILADEQLAVDPMRLATTDEESEPQPIRVRKNSIAREYPQFFYDLMAYHQRAFELVDARLNADKFVNRYVEPKEKAIRDELGDLTDPSEEEADKVRKKHLSSLDYIRWVHALSIQDLQVTATARAVEGARIYKDETKLMEVAARQHYREWLRLGLDDSRQVDKVKEALEALYLSGLKEEAMYSEVSARMADLIGEGNTDAMKAALQMADEKTTGPTVFLMAGDRFTDQENWEQALVMYRQASRVDESNSEAYNNTGWILGNIPPINIDEALELVNRAIELRPEHEYYETRGQIHVRLSQWKEAAEDLERALNGDLPLRDIRNAHMSLVRVYTELGEPELAAAHRQYAGP